MLLFLLAMLNIIALSIWLNLHSNFSCNVLSFEIQNGFSLRLLFHFGGWGGEARAPR